MQPRYPPTVTILSVLRTYPNKVEGEIVVFLGTLDPLQDVGGGLHGVRVGAACPGPNPAREGPRKTIQLDVGVALEQGRLHTAFHFHLELIHILYHVYSSLFLNVVKTFTIKLSNSNVL